MKNIIALLSNFHKFAFINAPSVAVTSNYNGEVADAILSAIKLGNEAVEKGSVYVEPTIAYKLSIPIFSAADDVLTDAVADPTSFSEAFTWSEKTITPLDAMFLDKVNPRHFEHVWRPYQPVGPLVDKVDNPKIKAAIIEQAALTVGKQLGKLMWQGDTTAGASSPLRFFDGYIKLMLADADVIDVTTQGAITAANVISVLEAVEAAIPSTIWEDPSVVFHMNTGDYRLYLQAARALDFKGPNIGEAALERFAGRQIRYYTGMPAGTMCVAKATAGRDSNLWAAVNAESDADNVKFERYRPESENYIVKMLLKMGVNFGIGSEIVLYRPS